MALTFIPASRPAGAENILRLANSPTCRHHPLGNGLYKAEVIHRRGPWRSFEAVEFATLERVDRFSNRRLPEPIGNIPPAQAEARYYAQSEELAKVA